MKIRHKVPAIFSLSMVDMLCCALGCVILVWLLNAKQAEDDAEEQRQEIDTILSRARSEREESGRLLADARGQHDKATARVRELTGERDKWAAEARSALERVRTLDEARSKLSRQLADEQGKAKDLTARLDLSGKRATALEADVRAGSTRLTEEQKRVAGLEKQLGERSQTLKDARAALARREELLKGLQADLRALDERNRTERERADGLAKKIELAGREAARTEALLKDARTAKDKVDGTLLAREKALAAAARREQAVEKDLKDRQAALDAATARLARVEKEGRTALDEAQTKLARAETEKRALVAAAEGRFAGIELTGRRVLFLVDSSGSMEMLDDKTESPDKWVEVRRTVERLMRSLPGLEKYQLITFAAVRNYPLGSEGSWLDYDAKSSPGHAVKALAAIKPKGGTNMYTALEAAFSYRKAGLDTIYLLSDGLPNQGVGLSGEQAKTLSSIDKGVVLGQHIRRTLKTTWNNPLPGQARVKIHTVGFFFESPDLGSFLWALARENDGSFVGMSRP